MYSFSTSWNYWRASSGRQIIDEVQEIGLNRVELNFSLPVHLFHDIKAIARKGEIQITSLHNYCPLPLSTTSHDKSPDMFSLCAKDEAERRKAVEFTKKTMDAASSVGAQAVVMHAGRVPMLFDKTHALIECADRGEGQSVRAQRMREKYIGRRRRKGKKHYSQLLKTLDELNDYAFTTGIKIGLETRNWLYEMPTLEEFVMIFEEFRGGRLYYWHDVGHAMVKEYLGLESHGEYLKCLGPYLLGWHIHDANGVRDHKAPGFGTFDFKRLLPTMTAETINVLEPHHPATKEEVKQGLEFLKREILSEGSGTALGAAPVYNP